MAHLFGNKIYQGEYKFGWKPVFGKDEEKLGDTFKGGLCDPARLFVLSINLWFDENLNHRTRACSTFYNVLLT
jgi:hypothetical protein